MSKELLQELTVQEKALSFKYFNNKTVLKIAGYILNKIQTENLTVGFDIFVNNKQVFHYLAEDCIPDHDNWLRRKRNTVNYFHKSTMFVGVKQNNDLNVLVNKYGLNLNDYAIIGGGYPIRLQEGGVIGAIAVTGLLPEEDHALIIEALEKVIKEQ